MAFTLQTKNSDLRTYDYLRRARLNQGTQQARARRVLSLGPGRAGDGRQRDVLSDRHALSELLARATYPALAFGQYPGEVATSDADDAMKAKAQKDAEAALAGPLEVYRAWFLDGKQFIGGDTPSIADIRFAATLEFLRAIDYDFPAWAEEYMSAMESSVGEPYSEPAADVRGYIDYVRSQSG